MVIKIVNDKGLLESYNLPQSYAGSLIEAVPSDYQGTIYYIELDTGFSFPTDLVTFDLAASPQPSGEARENYNTKPNDI